MPDQTTLRANARERLDDARALYAQGRYDGAAYLCGYAVEFALKARVCALLGVDQYPEQLPGYKIHALDTLLLLSGCRGFILGNPGHSALWVAVRDYWRPEMRYDPAGSLPPATIQNMIEAVRQLLLIL